MSFRFAMILLGLALALIYPIISHAAELRDTVTVGGEIVTLGDLFDDAGEASSVAAAKAPEAGGSLQLSVSRISLLARRNGIDWRNTLGLTHVIVYRKGMTIAEGDVSAAVSQAIIAQTPSLAPNSNLRVDFDNGAANVQVGEMAKATVKIEQLSFNPRNGAFAALVRAPADDMNAKLRRVSGRAITVLDVPVLKRDMAEGETIRPQDLDTITLPASRVSQDIVISEAQLVGLAPKRILRGGDMIRSADIRQPLAVTKGALVDIAYSNGALTLMMRGRAVQSGAVGDVIDIVNPTSNRKVQGVVTGANMVRIQALGAPQVSNAPTENRTL